MSVKDYELRRIISYYRRKNGRCFAARCRTLVMPERVFFTPANFVLFEEKEVIAACLECCDVNEDSRFLDLNAFGSKMSQRREGSWSNLLIEE